MPATRQAGGSVHAIAKLHGETSSGTSFPEAAPPRRPLFLPEVGEFTQASTNTKTSAKLAKLEPIKTEKNVHEERVGCAISAKGSKGGAYGCIVCSSCSAITPVPRVVG